MDSIVPITKKTNQPKEGNPFNVFEQKEDKEGTTMLYVIIPSPYKIWFPSRCTL